MKEIVMKLYQALDELYDLLTSDVNNFIIEFCKVKCEIIRSVRSLSKFREEKCIDDYKYFLEELEKVLRDKNKVLKTVFWNSIHDLLVQYSFNNKSIYGRLFICLKEIIGAMEYLETSKKVKYDAEIFIGEKIIYLTAKTLLKKFESDLINQINTLE